MHMDKFSNTCHSQTIPFHYFKLFLLTTKPPTMTHSAQSIIPLNHHKTIALRHSKMKWQYMPQSDYPIGFLYGSAIITPSSSFILGLSTSRSNASKSICDFVKAFQCKIRFLLYLCCRKLLPLLSPYCFQRVSQHAPFFCFYELFFTKYWLRAH